mmetsp:Transcript_27721/g.81482  ORF Transcript_27721/g.81482 Transcript_27721/m.81482 type:complete len:131 (+) Transcript_27721:75-467(+)
MARPRWPCLIALLVILQCILGEYTYYRGYVPMGNTLFDRVELTVEDAMDLCDITPQCQSFTYQSYNRYPDGTLQIFFKTSDTVIDDPDWGTYVKTDPPETPETSTQWGIAVAVLVAGALTLGLAIGLTQN